MEPVTYNPWWCDSKLMATIKEVAALAGVSVATVSRVLNKNGYVNKDTEGKIVKAIKQLQYEPSSLARGLAGKSMATIALILPDITNPFFPEMAKAVENTCRQHGYSVFLCNADDQAFMESSYIDLLKRRNIDGIIIATSSLGKSEAIHMENSGIPFVVLDRAPAGEMSSMVRSNNFKGSTLAVTHLLGVGCRKIAHIYGPQDIITANERMIGYEDAVKHFPWYTPSLMVPGDFQIKGGMEATERLLERHPDVDGIYAGNDLMAIGALKTLQRNGIKVPEQVAVCGFDGIAITQVTEPEITTVAQPIFEMGKLATQLLIKKINGEITGNEIHELDVTLIARRSTARA
jgi:LacI family transcriptional regulator